MNGRHDDVDGDDVGAIRHEERRQLRRRVQRRRRSTKDVFVEGYLFFSLLEFSRSWKLSIDDKTSEKSSAAPGIRTQNLLSAF